jgi:hypothetical protein
MSAQSTQNVHLLVLIHGMWGNPSHLASMHRIIEQARVKETSDDMNEVGLHVILPETNRDESTYDGIDWGGERVAAEASDPWATGVSQRLIHLCALRTGLSRS